jgi:hypothetical protein
MPHCFPRPLGRENEPYPSHRARPTKGRSAIALVPQVDHPLQAIA